VTFGCALLVVVDDIKEAVLGCVCHGRPHNQIVWEELLVEVDSATVKVTVAPHLEVFVRGL
jgi:hypothetical protein